MTRSRAGRRACWRRTRSCCSRCSCATGIFPPALPASAPRARRGPEELKRLALNTLTCWQHSILDFLSCMGIDDIQKTSGNTMAITITADWIREVDRLATPEFGRLNQELNARRIAAEPV